MINDGSFTSEIPELGEAETLQRWDQLNQLHPVACFYI